MGASYGSIQVFCQTQEALREVLEDLSAKRKGRFWIGPALGNWTGVYPVHQGLDPSLARDLARRLGGEIFSLIVYHEDVFSYGYYRDGKRIAQYGSLPGHLGKPTDATRKAVGGRPEIFAHLVADAERFAQFRNQIAEQADQPAVFASELLVALASALGIANVQTSYEYLSDGENHVEGWDQFVHVPDLRTEQSRSRKADADHQEEVRRLIREGLLLAERGGHRGRDVPFLHWCPAPSNAGFLFVAKPPEFSTRDPVPLEWIGPPWTAGPKPTGLTIDPRVEDLVSSPSGRTVAIRSVDSDPSASVWDLSSRRCVTKLARDGHIARHVTFMPDESAIVCSCAGISSGQIAIVPTGPGDPRFIAWPLNVTLTAVHPNGQAVAVVDGRNRLSVLDLPSGQSQRPLFVGGVLVPGEARLLLGHDYPRDWLTIPIDDLLHRRRNEVAEAHGDQAHSQSTDAVDSLERKSPPQLVELGGARIEAVERDARMALAEARKPGWLEQRALSREWVHQLAFDPGGEHLFAATSGGLRVYSWNACVKADAELPPPILAVDANKLVSEAADGFISIGGAVNDFIHDEDRDWLLFGGVDGRLRYLDLATGQAETLLELPGRRPINRLSLSRDRTVLGVSCGTDMIEDGSARPMRSSAALQFWDFQALCNRRDHKGKAE